MTVFDTRVTRGLFDDEQIPTEMTEETAVAIAGCLCFVLRDTKNNEIARSILKAFANLAMTFTQFESVWKDANEVILNDTLDRADLMAIIDTILEYQKKYDETGEGEPVPTEMLELANTIKDLLPKKNEPEVAFIELTPEQLENFFKQENTPPEAPGFHV